MTLNIVFSVMHYDDHRTRPPNIMIIWHIFEMWEALRATSHMRLRAHDHNTSSTLIGGKGRARPSSLHITLEGPTKYVNARRV